MKHALITLIIVILFVLIVVPLLYIAIGRLKNPIDMFALNKIGKSGAITQNSKFISPNYIPESGSSMKTTTTSGSFKKTVEDVESCFNSSMQIVSEEFMSIKKEEGTKLNVRNDITGTTRYFENFYPTIETEKTVSKKKNILHSFGYVLQPGCAKNGTKESDLLAGLNDTGIFLKRMMKDDFEDFDFTDKGLTTINGLQYYWYMYEDKDRLYAGPKDELYYIVFYSTYVQGIYQTTSFMGTNLVFGTPRDFLNQTQAFLGGTVYGTSTPSVAPVR